MKTNDGTWLPEVGELARAKGANEPKMVHALDRDRKVLWLDGDAKPRAWDDCDVVVWHPDAEVTP